RTKIAVRAVELKLGNSLVLADIERLAPFVAELGHKLTAESRINRDALVAQFASIRHATGAWPYLGIPTFWQTEHDAESDDHATARPANRIEFVTESSRPFCLEKH